MSDRRRESQRAQNDAAYSLITACNPPRTFRQAVNGSASLPIPAEFNGLLTAIDAAVAPKRRKSNGGH